MASSGIRRKVDDLGRVVIPAGIRRALGIREGDPVEVTVEGERVVLAKPQDACVFCGREEDDLTGFRGRLVCRDCLATLGSVDERRRATAAADARASEPAPLPDWDAPPRRSAPAASPRTHREAPPHRPAAAATPATAPVEAPPTSEPAHAPERPGVPARSSSAVEDTPDRHAPPPEPAREDAARRRDERAAEEERDVPPRRPPYDPASTTAW